jgi:hypothetical protein
MAKYDRIIITTRDLVNSQKVIVAIEIIPDPDWIRIRIGSGSGLDPDPDWIRIPIGSGSGSVFSLKCWIRICIK